MNIQEVTYCNDCGSDVYTSITHNTVTVSCTGDCGLTLRMKIKPHPQLGNLVWDMQGENYEIEN
jgi:hypothetical protein